MAHQTGKFVISLDFELYWGVRDVRTLVSYRKNLEKVWEVVPSLLELFNEFEIKATWATVGFLFFENKQELLKGLPSRKPNYEDLNLSPYLVLDSVGENEQEDPFHFAASLVKKIRQYPKQEIATHTFCHYYCLEPGQSAEEFRSDLLAAKAIAASYGIRLQSLVFPRNQFNREYLQICADEGITSYRGNEPSWMYKESNSKGQTPLKRAFRLADAYLNISGNNCTSMAEISSSFPYNIPASRFLRPYIPSLSILEVKRLDRIKNDLTHAAKNGLVYHLWWHPHNFGSYMEENMLFLKSILEHYKTLEMNYGMESVTMAEISRRLQENNK